LAATLFLARDRFGIKPLYYWVAPGNVLCFASEIKAFTAFPGWSAVVNPQRAYDFLVWTRLDHSDETMFAGVHQLPPGHCVRIATGGFDVDRDGRIATTCWYQLEARHFDGSFEAASAEFRERFVES